MAKKKGGKKKKATAIPKALVAWENNCAGERARDPVTHVEEVCMELAEANGNSLQPAYPERLGGWASLSTVAPVFRDSGSKLSASPSDDSWMDSPADASACVASDTISAPLPPSQPYVVEYHASPLDLSSADRLSIYNLFLVNMGDMYKKSAGGLNEDEKVEELFDIRHSRYLVVRDPGTSKVVAFTHFRYTVDLDLEEGQSVGDDGSSTCVYIFEIQVSKVAKGGGLGRRMMDIVEKLGELEKLPKATLTVFKANLNAVRFYVKLGYKVDTDIDPNTGEGEEEDLEDASDYFILSKPLTTSHPAAKYDSSILLQYLDKYKLVQ
ncbi:hypothetical protein TrCOL_g9977 [Triparma columacea]|uniref:N-alpha-acetyltransferase 40 n=1 Tax=Triparma columacea TaxID=722753 RepID=A0A9W7GNS8_9STRA|nr:hypothetical protein TrCOL_g9977 [Triparma columacea]